MVSYYERFGYRRVIGGEFEHPRLKEQSITMINYANLLIQNKLNDYLATETVNTVESSNEDLKNLINSLTSTKDVSAVV